MTFVSVRSLPQAGGLLKVSEPVDSPLGVGHLFMGALARGKPASIAHTLIETAWLNGVDSQAWLADVLNRIPEHPRNRIDELLPWNFKVDTALSNFV